jgi:small subunit ribosomal protein S1
VDRASPSGLGPPAPGQVHHVAHAPTIVEVEVVSVRSDEVEVKLADGRVGVIDPRDFARDTPPGPGDHLDVALLSRQEPKGRVVLSYQWARKHHGWEALAAAKAAHTSVTGLVQRAVKGGLVVEVEGLRAFLPASLVDEHQVDLDPLVGTEVSVQVVDVDEAEDRLVVSRRDHLRRERRSREKELLGTLTEGQHTSGQVVELLEFGARVDLGGGVVGLVHRSELSWSRVSSVGELVSVGDQVDVVVVEVNRSRRRIALSMRRLTDDPLADVEVGHVGDAEITRLVEYGAFARLLDSGAEGLIHMSEISDLPGSRPEELVVPGDRVLVMVIDLDRAKRRLGLSIRRAVLS